MNSQKLSALLFGLALAGVAAAVGYFYILPKSNKSNLEAVRDYNRKISVLLGEPPSPDGPPFIYKPNITVPEVLTTNSLGMRSPELAAEKKLPRILILGDSFTFGYGLVEGEPYCDILSKQLAGKAEIANAAVSGFEIQDSAAQFLRFVDRVKPDCVVVTFVSNDLDDSRVYQSGAGGGYVREPRIDELRDGMFASTTNLLRLAIGSELQGEAKDKFIMSFLTKGTDYLPLGVGPFARSRWERYKSEFAKIVEGAKRHNAKILLFGFAPKQAPAYGNLYSVCKEFGVPMIVQDDSLNLGDPKYRLSWDPHPNGEANKIFADRLLRALVADRVVDVAGVEPLAPLEPDANLIAQWRRDTLAPARYSLSNSVVFMPREQQSNLHQVIGGFEDSMGLLGPRAIILLHSDRIVSKLRITARAEGKLGDAGDRELEVFVTGGAKPAKKVSVSKDPRDFDIDLNDSTIEKIKLEKETFLVEVDLRDAALAALPPAARKDALSIRILRLEIY